MNIYKIRAELGLSREQFAEKIGVRRETVWSWEMGKTKPSPLAMFALEKMLREKKYREADSWEKKTMEIDELIDHKHPEEARKILGLSLSGFTRVLGCSKSTYLSWICEGRPIPAHYRAFIKFLLAKKNQGKLKKVSSPYKDQVEEYCRNSEEIIKVMKKRSSKSNRRQFTGQNFLAED